jgi:general secretion pathway protein D
MKTLRNLLTPLALLLCVISFLYFLPFSKAAESNAQTDPPVRRTEAAVSKENGAAKVQGREKKVSFNFVDVDISAVVKFISEVTGKNFVFDDKVKGNITIIAPSKLSVDEAFDLFTSVLELKGFTVIPSGKIYKIVSISQAKQSGTELLEGGGASINDSYITRLIPLKSISASKAMSFFQPLISKEGHISSFGPGNMLMIVDSASNIEKILKIIEAIDRPGVEEPELVLLKYANAEDVVKIITEALVSTGKTQPYAVRSPRMGEAAAVSVEEEKPNVFADSRLNAVVMVAGKQEKDAMKRMIALLDVPLPGRQARSTSFFSNMPMRRSFQRYWKACLPEFRCRQRPDRLPRPDNLQRVPLNPAGK